MGSSIFISYRRQDAAQATGRLYDDLVDSYGPGRLFRDLDTIPGGKDFDQHIEQALASCRVVLAVIGPGWLTATKDGQHRLDDPADLVRRELAAALRRGVPVIPILLDRTTMPTAQELPDEIAALVRAQAVELTDRRWRTDVQHLVATIDRLLAEAGEGELELELTPLTSSGRLGARHELILTNRGDGHLDVQLSVTPSIIGQGDRLVFAFDPPQLSLPPGARARARLRVRPRRLRLWGASEHAFSVRAAARGVTPGTIAAGMRQQGVLPVLLGALAVTGLLVATLVAVWPQAQVSVPSVAGLAVEEAVARLEQDFSVRQVQEPSAEVASGLVLRTEPAARQLHDKGSTVILYVSSGLAPYDRYERVTDDTKHLSMETPVGWSTIRGGWWTLSPFASIPGRLGPGMNVTADVEAWGQQRDPTTPGVFFGASSRLAETYTPTDVIRRYNYPGCTAREPSSLTAQEYVGAQVEWVCPEGHSWYVIALWPADHAFIAHFEVKLVDERDQAALERILSTFRIKQPLPQ